MHIDDWNDEFLSRFSPEEYLQNLKRAKIQNAMLYLQSHVGLCYYPTKTAKMHNALKGREDMMKQLADMCRKSGIAVTGYYSLIYNNWAHDAHPEWRMITEDGKSEKEMGGAADFEFAKAENFRYGLCCPNNMQYRAFVLEQIKEIAEYFTLDGMFFDMLFWQHPCYCEACRKRWEKEVGGEIPRTKDQSDPMWILHMKKLRDWLGEFANWVTSETKKLMPGVSVEHNCAGAVQPGAKNATAEEVNDACDYAGGDLYGDKYNQSFTCKFYRNLTKNQPFEYMFSRCYPALSMHTTRKSRDVMRSSVFLTAAHHGATLVIDAIDPVGTMDERLYEILGGIFDEEIPYEKYYEGDMLEDVGIYYTFKSKFNMHGEPYVNHNACVNVSKTMIYNNISHGITGGYHDIKKYKAVIAPCLTEEDDYDVSRLLDYVRAGGQLYFSGADNKMLLKEIFGAEVLERTEENVLYVAPKKEYENVFGYFNEKYPMHFCGTAPIVRGISEEDVIAHITLPYTMPSENRFASIHSNPPGKKTNIPAIATAKYGKGRVIWSALCIEHVEFSDYREIFLRLLEQCFDMDLTVRSDAARDVELTTFYGKDSITVNAVLLNDENTARRAEGFEISIKSDKAPKSVCLLPDGESVDFQYDNKTVKFKARGLDMFDMYRVNI